MKLGLPFGISTTFWFIIGLIRSITEEFYKPPTKTSVVVVSDVAVVLPAHNEEKVIAGCIRALKQSIPAKQIYVASDGSTDQTAVLAFSEGCHVIENTPGIGKAKTLIKLITHFHLYERYKFIFIIDADTKIDKEFIPRALPLFEDPNIAVVFANARIRWQHPLLPNMRYYFISYRERLNRMLQYFLMYGQTWKYTNFGFVIPGFATIYRSSILQQLKIDTPGLIIEDFNLAFQLHKKKLGTATSFPFLIGWDQVPDNLVDYWKQVRRWNIGYFQTVKKNGVWLSWFWLFTGLFSFEVILNSIFNLFIPVLIGIQVASLLYGTNPLIHAIVRSYNAIGPFHNLSLLYILISVFLFDYAMTIVYGLIEKKPQFIIYGLFFYFMHLVTSLILISAIIPGFFKSSDGRWVSPKRM